jgi:hypothetical protein
MARLIGNSTALGLPHASDSEGEVAVRHVGEVANNLAIMFLPAFSS